MDIQTETTTVVQHKFTVIFDSEEDARAVLVNPTPFQRQLRRVLAETRNNTHAVKHAVRTETPKPAKTDKTERKKNSRRKSKKIMAGGAYQKKTCMHCGRLIAEYMMANHVRKAHSEI